MNAVTYQRCDSTNAVTVPRHKGRRSWLPQAVGRIKVVWTSSKAAAEAVRDRVDSDGSSKCYSALSRRLEVQLYGTGLSVYSEPDN
jgi:hypothetical protein